MSRFPPAKILLLCSLLLTGAAVPPVAGQAPPPDGQDPFAAAATGEDPFPDIRQPGESAFAENGDQALPTDGFTEPRDEEDFGLLPDAASGDNEYKRLRYTGTAISAYEPEPISPFAARGLGCGAGYLDSDFTGAYIGVGASAFAKGTTCGRCVRIQCDDRGCLEPQDSIVAQVVDLCGDCPNADISIAIPAFANLTGAAPSSNPTLQVSWDFVDCSPFIDGTIKVLVKRGGNAYYQSFNFANARVPITAVQINGERLTRGTSNWWDWNPGQAIDPRGPFNMALLGANREVLRVRTARLEDQDLGVQFRASS